MSFRVPRGISPPHTQRPYTQPFPVGAALVAALPLHSTPSCLSSRVPCPMSFRVPRGISPPHTQRPYTQPFPVGAALVAALPLHSAPFLPVIQSPLPHVIPSPSRNLAIPHSTSLHPTIPRRDGPCGRPPSSFRPFLPVIQSPLMSFRVPRGISPPHTQRPYTQPFPVGAALVAALPLHSAPFLPVIQSPLPHVIPSPSRNLATPHSTSLHPTIPRRGGPCGRPLRSK